MTVKQLREELDKYPDNMDVFLGERMTEFTYGALNTVSKTEITFFGEGVPEDEQPKIECVTLTED